MIEEEIEKIKEFVLDFFKKMTMPAESLEVKFFEVQRGALESNKKDSVAIDVTAYEPQILIGQQGQTLFELERLLRIMLNKKLQKDFYVNLDINDYKKKKREYLKNMAQNSASQVALTKEKKVLPPMASYERRIIHAELSDHKDVMTESRGEGLERCVVIAPK